MQVYAIFEENKTPATRSGKNFQPKPINLAQARTQTKAQAEVLINEIAKEHLWVVESRKDLENLGRKNRSRTVRRTILDIVRTVLGLVDQRGICYASAATIADYAGISRSSFWRLWREIQWADLLVSERRKSGPNFIYLGSALISRMQELIAKPGWAQNPDSQFWSDYRQWLTHSIHYHRSQESHDDSDKSCPKIGHDLLNLNFNNIRLDEENPSEQIAAPHSPPLGEAASAAERGVLAHAHSPKNQNLVGSGAEVRGLERKSDCRRREKLAERLERIHPQLLLAINTASRAVLEGTESQAFKERGLAAVFAVHPIGSFLDSRLIRRLENHDFAVPLSRIHEVLAAASQIWQQTPGQFRGGPSRWVTAALGRGWQFAQPVRDSALQSARLAHDRAVQISAQIGQPSQPPAPQPQFPQHQSPITVETQFQSEAQIAERKQIAQAQAETDARVAGQKLQPTAQSQGLTRAGLLAALLAGAGSLAPDWLRQRKLVSTPPQSELLQSEPPTLLNLLGFPDDPPPCPPAPPSPPRSRRSAARRRQSAKLQIVQGTLFEQFPDLLSSA